MGNLRSVERAIHALEGEARIQSHLGDASKLIIPGVGAFAAAMERIGPLREDIRAYAASGKPILGICLGMQLLFEKSFELGESEGLALLRGAVRYLPAELGLKVPHVGWNTLDLQRPDGLNAGLKPGDQVYFVHSLYTDAEDKSDVATLTSYGIDFPSSVMRNNVWGTQFHPEKSSTVGLTILKNFLEC